MSPSVIPDSSQSELIRNLEIVHAARDSGFALARAPE
jgi:hypothetical protein